MDGERKEAVGCLEIVVWNNSLHLISKRGVRLPVLGVLSLLRLKGDVVMMITRTMIALWFVVIWILA